MRMILATLALTSVLITPVFANNWHGGGGGWHGGNGWHGGGWHGNGWHGGGWRFFFPPVIARPYPYPYLPPQPYYPPPMYRPYGY